MRKITSLNKELTDLVKSWLIVLVWALILLMFVQTAGIAIHETGHYLVGRFYGCENLSISLARLSLQDSLSNVSGWDTCPFPLVHAKDGSRICNYQTNIDSSAGLVLSLIVLIPLIIFVNKKLKRFHLKKSHLILMLIFVIIMAIKSASYDLFKIGECLVNTSFGNTLVVWINLTQTIFFPLLIFVFLVLDAVSVIKNIKGRVKSLLFGN